MDRAGEDFAAEDELFVAPDAAPRRPRWLKKRWAWPGILFLLLLLAALLAWNNRRVLADDLVADQLQTYGIPATYTIKRIGARTQIVSNIVVGDPARPDLTAQRAIVRLRHRFGYPEIGRITLIAPRLYGRMVDGRISFGTLDRFLYSEDESGTGLPDIELVLQDGRGRIETPYGIAGLKLDGSGNLADGFRGTVAATMPGVSVEGCAADSMTAYGRIATQGGVPRFTGPIRARNIACAGGMTLAALDADADLTTDEQFSGLKLTARIETGTARAPFAALSGVTGTVRGEAGAGAWSARYNLVGRGLETAQVAAALSTFEGSARSLPGQRTEIVATLESGGLRLGESALSSLQGGVEATRGTMLAPLIGRMAAALRREARGSALDAELRLRTTPQGYNLIVPRAEITGGSGQRIAALSRIELRSSGTGSTLAGNLALAGRDLPRLTGRMERGANGAGVFRLRMEDYAVGGDRLAIPAMTLTQSPGGALGFAGTILASGALPGGSVEGLELPVSGQLSEGGGLTLWQGCIRPNFRSLRYANLTIRGQDLTVCPATGRPILAYRDGSLRLAAGAPSLRLAGMLGSTPVVLDSGPIAFAYPGVLRARTLSVALGPADRPTRFAISDLDARLGPDIGGTFAGADVTLPSVPLDISEAGGTWRYADGALTLKQGALTLSDRNEPARFEPLIAREASLVLRDNLISASADLRDPQSDRIVASTSIRHSLATGSGHADLAVPGILFDRDLQPDGLTRLAFGVVANVSGIVSGTGRIDWAGDGTVTSTGSFSSEALDFAAAFGPVRGASGTIVFTDLLGLTTAPGQKLKVAAINPGVEVTDGEVAFELRGGEVLGVRGGAWPFMGGQLILRDVDINIGAREERRYVFEIVGLQAAEFVSRFELENINATGVFDGIVTIVFDRDGNGSIEDGALVSRDPGGNVSYLGELTYEDLSPIANFAFDALRSLDYRQMTIGMEGALTGDIVTRVRFDGVSQGEGASRNVITRRLAQLPIQFRINIRAPFYRLISSLKSLYDPAAVRDPRSLGLLSDDGTRLLRREISGDEVEDEVAPDDLIPDEPSIQTEESEGAL